MTTARPTDIASVIATDDRAELRLAALLEAGGQSRALRRTLLGIVVLVLVFIAWSTVAQVDELARARGEVLPDGHIQILQSEEGGSIVKLFVKDGDRVTAGQPIAEFANTALGKEQAQNAIKLGSLAIDRERMLAVLEGRKPDFSAYEQSYPLLVAQARTSFNVQIANRDAALTSKRSEGGQQTSLLAGLERERQLIARELQEARQRLQRLEDGASKGVVTQISLSEARQQVTAVEQRQADLVSRAEGMRSTLSGNSADVSRVRAELNQQLSIELSRITEQYRELQAENEYLGKRQTRALIKSPVDGKVTNLPQSGEGTVLAPGGVVAEVVPDKQEIVMEAMVTPRDIGFVKEGQRVSVKIDSFDAARFGSVEGRVKRVAPTSSKMKENGAPFYKVEVVLATPYVGAESHRLIPGMTGEADIATGRKSVMQYLLKPVFTASDTAFHER